MVPANARQRHPVIEQRIRDVAQAAETSLLSRIEPGDGRLGSSRRGGLPVCQGGLSDGQPAQLGMTWPLPEG